jgi:outer membrane receptor protein involved in Fe transport
MRNTIRSSAAIVLAVAWLTVAVPSQAQAVTRFNLPAQSLADSLRAVAGQTNSNILFDRNFVAGLSAQPLEAELTQDEALKKLLSGTGLTFQYLDEKTVTIVPVGKSAESTVLSTESGTLGSSSSSALSTQYTVPRLVQANPQENTKTPADTEGSSEPVKLEEVIVSAQKRGDERLQDVPIPVTAVSAQALVDSNQVKIQDYYTRIPSLNFTVGIHGEPFLSIRGLTSGEYVNPTVGISIDDLPYGGSAGAGGAWAAPDFDPSDLARLEVLRGPQGTLYGANSLGGLLKFVTIDPSTNALSGRVQAGVNSVRKGDDLGSSIRGAVNVPLSDTFAVRASGFTRSDPGYIDNLRSGEKDVNSGNASGGLLSALWRPSENSSLKLMVLRQDAERDGAFTSTKDLEQGNLRASGLLNRKSQFYSAALNTKVGSIDLTALSGYGISTLSDLTDFLNYGQSYGGASSASLLADPERKTEKFTQEIRFSGLIGQHFDWLFGAFFTDERGHATQRVLDADPVTGAPGTELLSLTVRDTYKEYAAFADLTWKVTDRFDFQVGGRQSTIKQTREQDTALPILATQSFSEGDSKDRPFTFLFTPRFKVSSDLMMYARFASGYRPGGPNFNVGVIGAPSEFSSDKTLNYEIGLKGNVLGRALTFDASVYYIDWKDMQLALDSNGFQYNDNVGQAKSQGVELSVELRPVQGLMIAAWVAWNDAVLQNAFPPEAGGAPAGSRLPFSSEYSGSLSLDQEFPFGSITGFVGGSLSYVDDRSQFVSGTPVFLPAYWKADLSAGGRYDSWTVNLFVNNVSDKRGAFAGGFPAGVEYTQPRTVGMSIARAF